MAEEHQQSVPVFLIPSLRKFTRVQGSVSQRSSSVGKFTYKNGLNLNLPEKLMTEMWNSLLSLLALPLSSAPPS